MSAPRAEQAKAQLATCGQAHLLKGKPPKPVGQIQATLKRIHNSNEHGDERGPLDKGLRPDGWVVVVSRADGWRLGACLAMLQAHDIRARLAFSRGGFTVDVAQMDFNAASAILGARRPELNSGPPAFSLPVLVVVWALIGGLIGVFPGMPMVLVCMQATECDLATAGLALPPCVAFGALLGIYLIAYDVVRELLPPPVNPGRKVEDEPAPSPRRAHPHLETDLGRQNDWYPTLFGGFCGFVLGAFLLILLTHSGWVVWNPAHGREILFASMYGAAIVGALIGCVLGSRTTASRS